MVVGNGQINCCHSIKNGDQNDRGSFAGMGDRLSHGGIVAGAVVYQVCFIRSEDPEHRVAEGFNIGVHARVNAALFGDKQPIAIHIGDHHLARAHAFCRLCHKVADRACADNDNILAQNVSGSFHRVHGNGRRLDHGAVVQRKAFRQRCELGRVHGKKVTGSAGRLESHDLKLLAQVVFPVAAGMTRAADDLRLNGHFLAHVQTANVFAQ